MRQRGTGGRIKSNTVCGRRFCNVCGRWKHVVYFRHRMRNGRLYPQPDCDACHNRYSKHDRKTMKGDRRAKRREWERLYQERLRRRRGIPPRPGFYRPVIQLEVNRLEARGVWNYLKRFYREEPDITSHGGFKNYLVLNGKPVASSDIRFLRELRTGERKTVGLAKADQMAQDYDLPLWELEEAGGARLITGKMVPVLRG